MSRDVVKYGGLLVPNAVACTLISTWRNTIMKKFALTLVAAAAMLLGSGAVAQAYPPGAGGASVTPASTAGGGTVAVTVSCQPGESVTATLNAVTSSAVVCPAGGSVTINVAAPAAAGTYTGTTNGSVNGALGSFTVTVTAPTTTLPATGGGGVSTMTIIAIGLLAVGGGLFGVSQVRRRQTIGV